MLAAGLSRRLGTGEQKILREYRGEKLVLRSLRACLSCFDVILVTGYKADEVTSCVKGFLNRERFDNSCRIVFNENFRSGQLSSCLAGLEFVRGDFMFALSDTPNLDSGLISAAHGAFLSMPEGCNVLRLFAGDKPVHPVVFRSSLKDILQEDHAANPELENIREILRFDDRLKPYCFDVGDAKYAKDMDFPNDFA